MSFSRHALFVAGQITSGLVMQQIGWRSMCLAYAAATLLVVMPIHAWISLRAGPRGAA